MDFDEYDYLEKTVEGQDDRDSTKKKKESGDKTERSYRKREEIDEGAEDKKSKRSRGDDENGSNKDKDRTGLGVPMHYAHKYSNMKSNEMFIGSDLDPDLQLDFARSISSESSLVVVWGFSFKDRRFRDKKEAVEPEADPERDQRTVFAYQMPLKATERDVYEFFSKAGKVRDVRLIMDRNSRRSKGVGYIEFYDAMSVPMAIALSGQLLLGQPVMVKPSEAEKNLVQSNTTSGAAGVAGPYGAVDRKLYVGNLHFNMTESQLRETSAGAGSYGDEPVLTWRFRSGACWMEKWQRTTAMTRKRIFEPFGPVELVQLPLDLETGHCKGFGFVQFANLEHAKAAQSLNGKLEIAGRVIKVSSVTDHVGSQDTTAKSADFDDDEGGLSLNAQSRALLMQKLDRSGITASIGVPGVPIMNGSAPAQQASLPIGNPGIVPTPALPMQIMPTQVAEPVGTPSECLLLKNMFDPATETEPDFDLDIKDDVEEECSKFGRVKHIYVDKRSAGFVYLRFETVEASSAAQRAMHMRWFARRLVSAIYMEPQIYEAKFKGEI
ncbi:Splicing factor, RBM39-like [Sesbania bispinosa]|nr:Splicing factor, RBM39-like [Sesbania bispinosa]